VTPVTPHPGYVRELTCHVPTDRRDNLNWRHILNWHHVADELAKAAAGADPTSVSIRLQTVLMLENVECRPKAN
jgi:hypothetical protein